MILHREQLDLDDYSFSIAGQEESDEGQLETVLGEIFWVDADGKLLFDDYDQPPDTELVAEWFVENGGPVASLHFGGSPRLKVDLAEPAGE